MGTPIISVMEWNGNSVKTDKSSSIIRFKAADDPNVNASNPLVIPDAGFTYSYEKWLRLRIQSGDPAEQLANIKFYTDGGNSFGGNVFIFGEAAASTDFRSASLLSTSNNPPQGGSGSKTMTTIFRLTSGSALDLTSAAETFSGTSTDIGRFVVMCMRVDPGAIAGTLTAETLSFSYDTSAGAVTQHQGITAGLNAALAHSGFTMTTSLEGLLGEASADGPFTALTGQEFSLSFDELLGNDFDVVDHDVTISGSIAVTAVVNAINGSASLGTTEVLFTPLASGTASFQYIGTYNGSLDTGSVAITVTDFSDTAILLPFYTLTNQPLVIEQRSGHARATGIDINKKIVSYDSGQERLTIDLSSGAALGLLVEDCGGNMLSNSALSGGNITNPTGWLTISDGARSAIASTMGVADAAKAISMRAAPISLGGPGGRPFLGQTLTTLSASVTFTTSMFVEYYTGNATGIIMGLSGFASVTSVTTPSFQISAGQLLSLPQRLSFSFMNIASAVGVTTGTVRYGLGINTSTSATMIISRFQVDRKTYPLTYTPDAIRLEDRPVVSVDGNFPFNTAGGSFVIQARTALAPSGSQILCQVDAGSAGNCHQFFRGTNGDIVYKIIVDSVQTARLAWPGIANDTTFRLAASYISGCATFTLNGGTALVSATSALTLPGGLTTMRIGHDISGNQWNGTIAELNVFRGQGVSPGGGGGGGGSDPGNNSPSSFYGCGHQMVSLYNTNQMKIAGGQAASSFLCRKNATVRGIKWYAISVSYTAGYNAFGGSFTAGPGGLIRCRIFQNNPTTNVPSTVVPGITGSGGASFSILDPHNDLHLPGDTLQFPEVSGSCNLSSSVIYHLVFDNIHASPPSNYCEIDNIKPLSSTGSGRVPHNPSIPDAYDQVQYRTTSVNSWSRYNQTPTYQLRFADGTYQGNAWVEVGIGSTDEGFVQVGGVTQIRQTMMPHETVTLSQINLVVRSGTIPTGLLVATTRQQSNGAVINTTAISPSLIKTAGGTDWLNNPVTLNSGPIVLSASKTYTVTFANSGGGFWGIGGIRDGSQSISHTSNRQGYGVFSSMCTVEGRAEKSTNSGSTWTGLKLNNNFDSDALDLMWYYTRIA